MMTIGQNSYKLSIMVQNSKNVMSSYEDVGSQEVKTSQEINCVMRERKLDAATFFLATNCSQLQCGLALS